MAELRTKILRFLCGKLRPWMAELVIRGIIPGRIGKYRTLDTLLIFEEEDEPGRFFK
jgi:hypothetical protein